MSKLSQPFQLSMELLEKAYEKSGNCYKVLSEELDMHYTIVLKMYEFNRIPNENYLTKVEKFLSRKNFKPKPRKLGRPRKNSH